MAFTYTGDPTSSDLDEVRFLVQDTEELEPLFDDSEISYAIAANANNLLAASMLCEVLSVKFAREADQTVGDLVEKLSQRSFMYSSMATVFRKRGNMMGAAPYVGGISIAGKKIYTDDTDRVSPSFTKGMHDSLDIENEAIS